MWINILSLGRFFFWGGGGLSLIRHLGVVSFLRSKYVCMYMHVYMYVCMFIYIYLLTYLACLLAHSLMHSLSHSTEQSPSGEANR